MADLGEHAQPWLSNQPTHSRLYWNARCEESGLGDGVWYLIPDTTLVSVEGWPDRFYTNQSYIIVAG